MTEKVLSMHLIITMIYFLKNIEPKQRSTIKKWKIKELKNIMN